jgi:hypothetical protein
VRTGKWCIWRYGSLLHQPGADKVGIKGIAYHKKADERS